MDNLTALITINIETLKNLVLDKQFLAFQVQQDLAKYGECSFDFVSVQCEIDMKIKEQDSIIYKLLEDNSK